MGPIRRNHLFNHSFIHVRANLSLFFFYVDLEYEFIPSNDLIGPNTPNKAESPL